MRDDITNTVITRSTLFDSLVYHHNITIYKNGASITGKIKSIERAMMSGKCSVFNIKISTGAGYTYEITVATID